MVSAGKPVNDFDIADQWGWKCRGGSWRSNTGGKRVHSAYGRAGVGFEIQAYEDVDVLGHHEILAAVQTTDLYLRSSKPFNCPLLREPLYLATFFYAPKHQ